jgi:predicted nuclease with TOPRIM domain
MSIEDLLEEWEEKRSDEADVRSRFQEGERSENLLLKVFEAYQEQFWSLKRFTDTADTKLAEQLELPGTKVLMKSGRQLPQVAELLERKGLLERAASLSVTLLEEKCIHMAAWFEEKSGQVIKWRIHTAESVYEWIWRLLSTEPFQNEEQEKTCYEDAFRGENFSSIVILNADGTLKVNGEEQELLQL